MYFKYTSLCKGELIKKYYEIVGLLSSEAFKKKKAFIEAAWYAYCSTHIKYKNRYVWVLEQLHPMFRRVKTYQHLRGIAKVGLEWNNFRGNFSFDSKLSFYYLCKILHGGLWFMV